MVEVSISKTSVNLYHITRRNYPEDSHLQNKTGSEALSAVAEGSVSKPGCEET
jgi:hypothetical protein